MRIGTRGSALALAQAELVRRAYLERFGDRPCELVEIRTEGDRDQARSLMTSDGGGLFVKELEQALAAGHVDCAVHSAKDLALEDPDGIEIAAFLPRAPAHDVLIRRSAARIGERPPGEGFVIATGSPRRRVQLAELWPGVAFNEVRGNIDTRIDKLRAGAADALVLAAAGVKRLGLEPEGLEPIALDACVPAPGQAAIAVQARTGDRHTDDLRWLNHLETSLAVHAERDLASALDAGCSTPLGAHVTFGRGEAIMRTALHDGERLFRVEVGVVAREPGELVMMTVAELRERGARWGSGT